MLLVIIIKNFTFNKQNLIQLLLMLAINYQLNSIIYALHKIFYLHAHTIQYN